MNRSAYLIIVILLSFSVLGFLAVQLYWLQSSYAGNELDFKKKIYEVIDEIGIKIQNRSDLASIKLNYVIEDGDTLVKTPARNKIILKTKNHLNIASSSHAEAEISQISTVTTTSASRDTLIIRSLGKNSRIEIRTSTNDTVPDLLPPIPDEKRLKNVMQKLISEVIEIDTESENVDTLSALISRSLHAKGLELPVEFSFEKTGAKQRTLARSAKYDTTANSFVGDLSAHLLLPSHRLLKLQFPNQRNYLLGKMKSAVVLSSVFSILILVIMVFVVYTIRKQKQLTELRNDFVNNMTHELKTPIATAAIALSALEKEQVKKDQEKIDLYHRILREENEKMNQHVERVLQLSMFEKSKLNIDAEVFDLRACIDKAISNFRLKAEAQQSPLLYAPGDKALAVKADAAKIELAINNILDNALKYGGPKNTIRIETIAHEQFACIYVSDEGIGISKDKQAFIFDRFYRVQGGDIHDVKGFGLGLSFVKQIIEMHKGSVACESELGKGSTFIIRLPLYA